MSQSFSSAGFPFTIIRKLYYNNFMNDFIRKSRTLFPNFKEESHVILCRNGAFNCILLFFFIFCRIGHSLRHRFPSDDLFSLSMLFPGFSSFDTPPICHIYLLIFLPSLSAALSSLRRIFYTETQMLCSVWSCFCQLRIFLLFAERTTLAVFLLFLIRNFTCFFAGVPESIL